jgi:hypothetical protein
MVTKKRGISADKASSVAPVTAVASKKPVAKKPVKTAAEAPAKAVPSTAKPAAKPKAPVKSKTVKSTAKLSEDQRTNYVQVAAFYIAERRGFTPGNPAEDWAAAEIEIDRLIASGQFAH